MRTTQKPKANIIFAIILLLLFVSISIPSQTLADSVQGFTVTAEHGVNFVGDTMNISATGKSFDLVSLILINSSGNQTATYLLQLNNNGTGTQHISTDNLPPDTYTINLAVRNKETNEVEIVANTTVVIIYDPLHILEKHVSQQDDTILKLMQDNQNIKELYQEKYAAMRNMMIFSLIFVFAFFTIMVLSIDWTTAMSRNKGLIMRKVPLRIRLLFGEHGITRGSAFIGGKEPSFYLDIQKAVIEEQMKGLEDEHRILKRHLRAIETAQEKGFFKNLRKKQIKKKLERIEQSIREAGAVKE